MKNKKLLALGLAMSMLVATLIGCGSEPAKESTTSTGTAKESQETSTSVESEDSSVVNGVNKTGYPIVDEAQTLSVVGITRIEGLDPNEVDIHNEIKELTNVNIDWEVMMNAELVSGEKLPLILSRKELPDIILGGITDPDYLAMIDAGQCVAIDEYMEEWAPNFMKVLEESPGLRESITAADGHIYAFPYTVAFGTEEYYQMAGHVTWINQDWLDAVGKDIPTTTEEFKEVLLAFKTQDPNGNGIADELPLMLEPYNMFDVYMGAWGFLPRQSVIDVRNLSIIDGEVVYAGYEDEFREALDYFHELWDLELIDPETFTQDDAMFSAKKLANPRVGGVFHAWQSSQWRLSDDADAISEYSILPPLAGPDGDRMYPQSYIGIRKRGGAIITKDCENIELAIRWIDTLIDPKYGYQFNTSRREGYHYVDNGGETMEALRDYNGATNVEEDKMVDLSFTCISGSTYLRQPKTDNPFDLNNEKAASDAIFKDYFPKGENLYPNVFLTTEENDRASELTAELQTYMDTFLPKWVINGGDDAAWEAHKKQLENLGVKEWVEIYKGALERYNSMK